MKINLSFFEHLVKIIKLLYDAKTLNRNVTPDELEYIDALLLQCQNMIFEEKGLIKHKIIMERFNINDFILKVYEDVNDDDFVDLIIQLDHELESPKSFREDKDTIEEI